MAFMHARLIKKNEASLVYEKIIKFVQSTIKFLTLSAIRHVADQIVHLHHHFR